LELTTSDPRAGRLELTTSDPRAGRLDSRDIVTI